MNSFFITNSLIKLFIYCDLPTKMRLFGVSSAGATDIVYVGRSDISKFMFGSTKMDASIFSVLICTTDLKVYNLIAF